MRLFVAVPIEDEAVRARLASLAPKVGRHGVKWVPSHQVHVTLKFLGDVAEPRLAGVKRALEDAFEGLTAFDLALEGVGCFPPQGPARVVWAGCASAAFRPGGPEVGASGAAGAEGLRELAARAERSLVAVGFPREERPFSAHLTLGRVKDPAAGREVARRVRELPPESFGSVRVGEVVLFSSVLGPAGPTYSPLQRVRLAPAPPGP